jgi:hypothetical protein
MYDALREQHFQALAEALQVDMQDEITARCRGCTISSMSYKEFASAHFG